MSLKLYIPKLLLTLFIVMMSLACNTAKNAVYKKPEKVSEKFFKLLKEQKYDEARALGTEHTIRILNAVEMLSNMGGGINIMKDNKKELQGCLIEGDTAICVYSAFTGPDEKVVLVRSKKKWLVELSPSSSQ